MKKGYALITDALIALVFFMVVITGLVQLSNFSGISRSGYNEFLALHYSSEDALDVLNKKNILDDIGYMWSLSRGNISSVYWSNASNISRRYLENMIPYHMGYKLLIEGQDVCNSSWNPNRTAEIEKDSETHATRLLVGYGENATVVGKTARAALTKIKEKITSEYIYFGGFVGEGNLSQVLFLPSDASVQSAYIEMNAGDAFDLYINGAQCGGTFNPVGGGMDASIKDGNGNISSCAPLINNKGSNPNTFELRFTGSNISYQYTGGGFIEVTYNTSEMNTDEETGSMRFYLPGINGIINYYSSFYVPGWVTSINTNISFINNYTTFFTIGDKTVFRLNGTNMSREIYNSSADLLGSGLFSHSELSEETVPIRVGTGDISYETLGGYGDVILTTDLSGSMSGGRLNDAKAADKEFVSIILNTTGNRIGLVAYGHADDDYSAETQSRYISCCDSNVSEWQAGCGWVTRCNDSNWTCDPYHPYNDTNDTSHVRPDYFDNCASNHRSDAHIDVNLSDNGTLLNNTIDSYGAEGGTCIACAIHGAVKSLLDHGDPSHKWSMVLMTDGKATMAPIDPNASDNHSMEAYMPGDWYSTGTDYAPSGKVAAVEAAREAYERYNITLYAVGFQTDAQGAADLQEIAAAGNGTYYNASNASALKEIYRNISGQIVSSSYYSQTVTMSGGNVSNSTLYGYPSSYIEFRYNTINISSYGKISITKKSERFNEPITCVGNVSIPPDVTVSKMKVTSYSGEHWSDYLNVSNSIYGGSPPEYRLWDYGVPYIYLGDPYIINIKSPWNKIAAGENNYIGIRTGDSQSNSTNCSADDRAIYTIRVSSILGYGNVFPTNEGCLWDIEFRNGNITDDLPIPGYYAGSEKCSYTSTNQSYDSTDAASDAVYRLLRELDIEDDGIVDVEFDPDALQFETAGAGGVRSLWGPIKVKLVLWI